MNVPSSAKGSVDPSAHPGLQDCRRCRRLSSQLRRLREHYPDYWNRPVPGHGPMDARLVIVGLAPGMHGANKTGIPFTGDASGDLLHDVLGELELTGKVYITNVVKCLPVANLPSTREVSNCQRFLEHELLQGRGRVLLILGGVAHRAVIRALGKRQVDYPFGHAAEHEIDGLQLIDSYHCSRYNTQTGRLTRDMFLDVVRRAARIAADD